MFAEKVSVSENFNIINFNFKGGGGEVHLVFFVKLDFEIAVDQQTKAHDQTFEGFRTPGAHRCPRDSHAFICSIFGSILQNHINMLKTVLWGAPLNTYKVL